MPRTFGSHGSHVWLAGSHIHGHTLQTPGIFGRVVMEVGVPLLGEVSIYIYRDEEIWD